MIASSAERLSQPRSGIAVFTATTSLIMSAHWLPMAIPSSVALGMVVFVPRLGLRAPLWWAMAAAWFAVLVVLPERMEDHVFLFAVWLVAVALSYRHEDESTFVHSVSWQARILLGVTFSAAVIWKLALEDFINGTALWAFILVDSRFDLLAFGLGIPDALLQGERDSLSKLLGNDASTEVIGVPDQIVWRVTAVAILTLLLEAAVAVSHLVPDRHRLALLRIPSIVLFAVVTYAVVPVLPFAFLLAVLAMSANGWRRETLIVFPLMMLPAAVRLMVLNHL